MHTLEAVRDLDLDTLETALVGQRSILPLPDDPHMADLLRRTQRVGEPIAADIALVAATSGSTGSPKGAMLSASNLVSSADATHQVLGGEGQWLLAMPAFYIAGIQVLVRSLVAGIEPVIQNVRNGFDIDSFAEHAARLSGRRYTALTPMQLVKAMSRLAGIEALRSFDAILIGGGPLQERERRAAAELGIHLISTYGASETSGGCVYDGKPLPSARVQIRSGRVWIGGAVVARGYRNAPAHEAFAETGWFRTNDAGKISDGRLQIQGRLDAIIDSGGLKIHPEVLEQRLKNIPGVEDAVVTGIPDPKLGQAIAAAYQGAISPSDIIAALDDMPRWQLPRHVRKVNSFPRTPSGKIALQQLQSLFTQGLS